MAALARNDGSQVYTIAVVNTWENAMLGGGAPSDKRRIRIEVDSTLATVDGIVEWMVADVIPTTVGNKIQGHLVVSSVSTCPTFAIVDTAQALWVKETTLGGVVKVSLTVEPE
jgi:hypothetical protein